VLELAQASAIGFGTRRWTGAGDEERTLATALDRGCSLVDVAGRVPEHAETAVGRVLSRRLDDVAVVATTAGLDPHAIVRRVRVAASRLRRDRLDVLVLDPTRLLLQDAAPDPEQAACEQAAVERALTAAFATCELLGDRGELGCYGVRIGASQATGARLLQRWVDLARAVRADHRLAVVQLPCWAAAGRGGPNDLVLAAHRAGLRALGTDPLPVWPRTGAAPLATCQQHLLDGVDHVVVDPQGAEQVRAMQTLLPLRSAA
jgi:aryl-alcohol dehydrogenase-like predicted oxidoreductase